MKIQYFYRKLVRNQLVKDSFWSLVGNVVGRGLSLVAGILVARMLGKDIFGEYGIIKTTVLTVGIFSTFGLGYTATKFVAELKESCVEKVPVFLKVANYITVFFSGVTALLLFSFSETIALNWFEAEHLSIALKILSVLIVFNAITTTQVGVLSGFGCFKEIAKINSWVGALTFIFSVLLTYWHGLNGALYALLAAQVINCCMNFLVVRREVGERNENIAFDRVMLKKVVGFSIPIALQEATYSITSWLGALLLIRLSTYGEFGVYSAAMQWNAIVLFIPGIMRNVVLSHLAKNNSNKTMHSNILNKSIVINFVSTLVPCVIVVFASPWIDMVYGESFKGVSFVISIAVFSTLFVSVSGVYVQAFMSINKNWIVFVLTAVRDIGKLIVFVLLIKIFSIAGASAAAISLVVVHALYLLAIGYVYERFLKKSIYSY